MRRWWQCVDGCPTPENHREHPEVARVVPGWHQMGEYLARSSLPKGVRHRYQARQEDDEREGVDPAHTWEYRPVAHLRAPDPISDDGRGPCDQGRQHHAHPVHLESCPPHDLVPP